VRENRRKLQAERKTYDQVCKREEIGKITDLGRNHKLLIM
jgi:hypothetical protein